MSKHESRRPAMGPVAIITVAALAAVTLALVAGTSSADDRPPPRPVVVVQGEAELRAAPDRAFVTVAVESRDKDPKAAQQQNAKTMAAVSEQLSRAGIQPDAVRTLAYQLDLEVDWQQGKRVPRGYLARNAVEVRVDDVTKVGEIIDLAVAAGANDVTGVRFDLKDRSKLERDALEQAVREARSRAEAAAAGGGVEILGIERIEEQGGHAEIPRPLAMQMRAAAPASVPTTTISAGEITITSRVTLTAAIK
jgi:uncharacterized protein